MAEQRQSALQRIQVGIVGLVVVLLFVTLANMVLDRVTNEQNVAPTNNGQPAVAASEQLPDEPLAELGVTPVAKDDGESTRALEAPSQNIRQVPQSAPPQ